MGSRSLFSIAASFVVTCTASVVVLAPLGGLPDFLVLAVAGFLAGLIAEGRSGFLAAAIGVIAAYPIALVTGILPFLGDAWPIAMMIALAVTVIGFASARLSRRLLRRRPAAKRA